MTNSDRFTLRAAVYLLIVRDGKVLLCRRHNTGWRDGDYTLVAGHVDGGEPMRLAMSREAKEEAGIQINPEDLHFVHVMHQTGSYEYVDFYFETSHWEGEPANCEPEKCDDMQWFPIDALPDTVLPNVRQALLAIDKNERYSEFGW